MRRQTVGRPFLREKTVTAAHPARWIVLAAALCLPALGSSACGSNPAQFMGSRYHDAYYRSPAERLRTAATQVGRVVGSAVAVAGIAYICFLAITEDDDEERLGPQMPRWDD